MKTSHLRKRRFIFICTYTKTIITFVSNTNVPSYGDSVQLRQRFLKGNLLGESQPFQIETSCQKWLFFLIICSNHYIDYLQLFNSYLTNCEMKLHLTDQETKTQNGTQGSYITNQVLQTGDHTVHHLYQCQFCRKFDTSHILTYMVCGRVQQERVLVI